MKLQPLKSRRAQLGATRLVPYGGEFVEAYNAAMQSDELQALTGSEPLSLEEEREMQQRWSSEDGMLCLIVEDAETKCFVGDVNAHWTEQFEEGVEEPELLLEVDVMICDPQHRRQGHAGRALQLLFQLLAELDALKGAMLVAKIKLGNEASMGLFRKLGFEQTSVSEVFQEATFVRALMP